MGETRPAPGIVSSITATIHFSPTPMVGSPSHNIRGAPHSCSTVLKGAGLWHPARDPAMRCDRRAVRAQPGQRQTNIEMSASAA